MAEKKKSSKKVVALIIVLILIGVGYVFGKPYYDLHFKTINSIEGETSLFIPSGSEIKDVADIIQEKGILDAETFVIYSEKLEYTEDKVESGKYSVTPGMKIKSLIYGLKNGNQEVKDVRITFNNCKTLEDIAGKATRNIEADSTSLINYLNDPKTKEKYRFRDETFISMFLPDTYEVGEWDMTAEEFTQFMADKYKAFWDDDRKSKASALNLEQSEISTVASIIEAEQGINTQEWKTIAGLYLNRVRKGMKLESDPTFKFCWGGVLDTVQRLTNEHKFKDCPYNTYLYAGLPPGPIRNPSKKALDAVLNAEDHEYIFMCAKPDNSGLHNFAETYSQHLENARKFWAYMDSKDL
ncbi:MAG: endolytic transglycosylase MltG [Crocinitomicaceae bacterium]|nr:endolytic transglycosylase MltG [Crocinitomicaceae bacterium]